MPRLRRAAVDPEVLTLLEASGSNIKLVSRVLRDLLVDYPERAELVGAVRDCEHHGDRIARDLMYRLGTSGGSRLPFSVAQGHALATALDDIVDHAEQTAVALEVYAVEAPMEQAGALAEVLVETSTHVAAALAALGDGTDLRPSIDEIHRLESDGDRLLRNGLASLFANGIDPMVVIRWKDIFESLESSIDACLKVAHVLEGVSLTRGAT
ncbi:MAG TPA: DUF47 family protein [Solirubrobacteraceae bacterium]|nr:DUF47 family protein [Solirubrobacteraceae bacterium]